MSEMFLLQALVFWQKHLLEALLVFANLLTYHQYILRRMSKNHDVIKSLILLMP